MKIAVTGATGLVGSALVPVLEKAGHSVVRFVRKNPSNKAEVLWDPDQGKIDSKGLEGMDAVVHLAGENIAGGRWTPERKERIRTSRVEGTRVLSETLARLKKPPRVLVAASAIGYYGDRADEILREESPPGKGFLPEVCIAWEKASDPARAKKIRVVNLRFGMILSPDGGALPRILKPFRMGVGGVVGSGRQYWSWITLEDAVGVIVHCLTTESLKGPVNAVARRPVTNREFTKALGRVLKRPTFFPMPAVAARMMMGELADALILASARVEPAKLGEAGYRFRHPELETALRDLLKSH